VSTALVASWAGTHGRGPFYGLPVAEAVLALQLFLSVMAVPLLCLGALIQERWRTEAELADRLAFEQLLSRMSGAFVLAPGRAWTTRRRSGSASSPSTCRSIARGCS
jgi:hypothetical protein